LSFLAVAFLIGYVGKVISPKGPAEKNAETSYAGGEDIPGEKRFPGYQVFYPEALFFTVLHVLALLLALLPMGAGKPGLLYAVIICFALLVLILR
jgi:NADH:ubiquinone oxidoreductase subunit 3 (subunit A)